MNSDPGVIRFECPHCGAKLKTATSNAGKETDCSSCNVTLTIPQQLSELDVIFDPATGIASAKKDASEKKEHEFDIDFSFSDDIDDAIAQEREARKQQETPEAAPEIKEPAEQFQPRAKIVISDEDLPHKKRLRREMAQRKENSTESPETGDGEDSTPPIVFKDDDEDGEELLLQVDSIDAPNMEPVEVASPEHDTSPIRVEGLTDDLIDVDDLYGVKCEICDTRIHVTREQVGTTVDCPVCFSKVAVTPPKEPSKSRPEWMGPKPGFKKPENPRSPWGSRRRSRSDPEPPSACGRRVRTGRCGWRSRGRRRPWRGPG